MKISIYILLGLTFLFVGYRKTYVLKIIILIINFPRDFSLN